MRDIAPALIVLALGACQAAAPRSATVDLESELARLRERAAELRGPASTEATPAAELSDVAALVSRIEDLAVHQAAVAAVDRAQAKGGRPRPASVSIRPVGPPADPAPRTDPAVEALLASLDALRVARGVHAENIARGEAIGFRRRAVTWPGDGAGDDATTARVLLSNAQGPLELTGNALDFAIEGPGFFEVTLPNGDLRYTRNGAFRQDTDGRFVTAEGHLLTDQISVPIDSTGVSASADGQVFSLMEGNAFSAIGTIRLSMFPNPEELVPDGGAWFRATERSGQPVRVQPESGGAGSLRQSYVERSNVDLPRELSELRRLERAAFATRLALAEHGHYAP
ncbi:MAG: flagellar hook basal-body protein [Planctomycetota bacterium]